MWDKFMPPEMPIVKRITKLEWLGTKQKPVQPQHEPKRIVIHHSYSPNSEQFEGDETIKAIHKYHTVNNGWSDIAYHYLISPDGSRIYEGRPDLQIGAHCGGSLPHGVKRIFGNTDSLGICLIGNYDNEQPTKEALYTLAILIFSLIEKYGMAQNAVYGHCEAWSKAPKTCPGRNLFIELFGENRWKNLKF